MHPFYILPSNFVVCMRRFPSYVNNYIILHMLTWNCHYYNKQYYADFFSIAKTILFKI